MTRAEIENTARELAALIGEPVPQIANEAELRDYWEYFDLMMSLRKSEIWMVRAEMRRKFDPPDFAAMRAKFEKRKRLEELKKSLPARGAEGRRRQGALIQERAKELAEGYGAEGMPRHQIIGRVAQELKRSKRRIRALLG